MPNDATRALNSQASGPQASSEAIVCADNVILLGARGTMLPRPVEAQAITN